MCSTTLASPPDVAPKKRWPDSTISSAVYSCARDGVADRASMHDSANSDAMIRNDIRSFSRENMLPNLRPGAFFADALPPLRLLLRPLDGNHGQTMPHSFSNC